MDRRRKVDGDGQGHSGLGTGAAQQPPRRSCMRSADAVVELTRRLVSLQLDRCCAEIGIHPHNTAGSSHGVGVRACWEHPTLALRRAGCLAGCPDRQPHAVGQFGWQDTVAPHRRVNCSPLHDVRFPLA